MVREINIKEIIPVVKKLCIDTSNTLPEEVINSLKKALQEETSPLAKEILQQLLENSKIAEAEQIPLCQDTGMTCVFVELGQDVHITGGDFYNAINEGVRQGCKDGCLRASVVKDPLFNRENTHDNTPAAIHFYIVPGDKLKITILPKGGGAENMTALANFTPDAGPGKIKEFVIDTIKKAGGKPCPPLVVGIGIGGTSDVAVLLAKKALIRPVGSGNSDPNYAKLEKELLQEINNTGIGPQGLGGKTTALAVHIEPFPSHIASLQAAVNLNCHSARVKTVVI